MNMVFMIGEQLTELYGRLLASRWINGYESDTSNVDNTEGDHRVLLWGTRIELSSEQ